MSTDYKFSICIKLFTAVFMLVLLVNINSFAQVDWTKYGNPVLMPGSSGEWDDSGFAGHTVIYDSTEGIYKMWYGASDGTYFRIGYATSSNGIEWAKYNDPSTPNSPYAESDPVLGLGPGSFESVWVYFPSVYFDGITYHMWYSGDDGTTERVGYATSPDGITWTKDTVHNPVINIGAPGKWDNTAVGPGPVVFNGTNYEMIYNGAQGQIFQGGYATSPDGVVWTKDTINNPIFPVGSSANWDYPRSSPSSVVYNSFNSKYYLLYSGGVFFYWKMGYATADAFSGPWTKGSSVMLEGTPGEWDSQTAAFPSVLYDAGEGIYKMWYMGASGIGAPSGGSIGYATAPLDTETVSVEFNSLTTSINNSFLLDQNYPNPFNPSTKIKYSVPQTSLIQIKIYDVLGNEIETLVNEEKPAGTYELTWNAVNLPSGVYFYQLKAGNYLSTKKMILSK